MSIIERITNTSSSLLREEPRSIGAEIRGSNIFLVQNPLILPGRLLFFYQKLPGNCGSVAWDLITLPLTVII
jgi:hypothetical protein